ncbi:MAG: SAM-dependent methyltransferase [Bacteroidales bacterium]
MKQGCIYLVPSFLAETNDINLFPPAILSIIYELDYFVVENLRTTRRFLKKIGYKKPFDQVTFYELNKKAGADRVQDFLKAPKQGKNLGIISEAGSPCIADPGSAIVSLAHELNIRVVPLPGLSSILLALMGSGFNGQSFTFHGYLPIDKKTRDHKLREIEKAVYTMDQTQIFMETPYRNMPLFESVLTNCQGKSKLCIAAMITDTKEEFIKTRSIQDWKRNKPDLHKKPAIFLLFK